MSEPVREKSLARTAGAVSLATLISRILGLIREMVVAKYFDKFATDAFFAAFRIPNLLRDLFAEGVLSAAFIPTFTDYWHNKKREEAWRLANLVLNALAVVLSGITLLILFGAKYLVLLLVSGYSKIPGKLELTANLARIMSPFLLTVALAAALMGILNTQRRFFIPALAPALFNVVSILCGVYLSGYMPQFGLPPITSMAIGALVGGLAQLLLQVPSLYRCGYHYQAVLDWNDPGLRRIFRLMIPAAFGLAATQINILIDNQIASYLGNGPVSWLNYAFRLMQLPIGLFGIAIATVNLATVSRKVATNDLEGVKSSVADAIKLAAFLNIPATAGLIVLRYPIVAVLYQRGHFTAEHTVFTGDALLFYSLGLFAYSLVKIVTPTFYALGDTRTPVRFAALSIIVKLTTNLTMLHYVGFRGLALGTSVASILNSSLLLWALRRKIGHFEGHDILRSLIKILIASIAMAFAARFLFQYFSAHFGTATTMAQAKSLGFAISGSLAVLIFISYLLKIEQVREIWNRIKGWLISS